MAQGFVNSQNITLPLAVAQGGTGVTTSTGTNKVVLSTAPTFDTSIAFADYTKGILGTTTNNSAGAGYVGEIISSVIAYGSAVSLTTNTSKNVTSISLTAGDWDVFGNVGVDASGYVQTISKVWISLASATLPDLSLYAGTAVSAATFGLSALDAPYIRVSIAGTTTVYLSCVSVFGSGTVTACGGIYARRVR